jgi:exodeoxyribonuclease VII large subunit
VENGLKVLAKGSLAVYAPRGEFQLIVETIKPQGEGALRLAYEKLKIRLTNEGLFKPERRRPKPFWPQRTAVLTAAGGAARQDFLSTALNRCPSATISLYPVRVQGAGAAEEIAAALNDLNQWGGFDLVVITRGGGGLEDLWAFNEEVLVRAVAASRLPVLAAIGHSTDESLVELAADDRAITPTAAAEAVFPDVRRLIAELKERDKALAASFRAIISRREESLGTLTNRLYRFETHLRLERQRLDNLTDSLAISGRRYLQATRLKLITLTRELAYRSPAMSLKRDFNELKNVTKALPLALFRRLASSRRDLTALTARLNQSSPASKVKRDLADLKKVSQALPLALTRRFSDSRRDLTDLSARLRLVSPLGILNRGYALITTEDGTILRSGSQVAPGALVNARLAKGQITAQVTETKEA